MHLRKTKSSSGAENKKDVVSLSLRSGVTRNHYLPSHLLPHPLPFRPSVRLRLVRRRSLEVGLIYVALCADERGTNSKPIISKKIQFCRIAESSIASSSLHFGSRFPDSKFPTETRENGVRSSCRFCCSSSALLPSPSPLMHIHHAALFWLSDSFRRRKTTEVICFAASNVRVELSETEWASPLNLKLTG